MPVSVLPPDRLDALLHAVECPVVAHAVASHIGSPPPKTWAERLALSPGQPLQVPRRRRTVDSFLAHLIVAAAVWLEAALGTDAISAAALAKQASRRLIA